MTGPEGWLRRPNPILSEAPAAVNLRYHIALPITTRFRLALHRAGWAGLELFLLDSGPNGSQFTGVSKDTTDFAQVVVRGGLKTSDRAAILKILESTGFFHPPEITIAMELVDDGLAKREASDYHFLVAESGGAVVGYSCFSSISCTQSSWDLHWIAVSPEEQGSGIGRRLLAASEEASRKLGATRLYVDTSGRAQYQPTRAFYERFSYLPVATLDDFYAEGDAKVVYLKVL
jgi:ribosomal protein S18 acetylase RimI-like enzyme